MCMQRAELSCELLLSANIVVTQDSERRVFHDAALAIAGGRILAVGPQSDLQNFKAFRKLHLDNALVMPGFINGHTHVSMTFLRGLADDLPLMEWLNGYIFPREKHLTAEIVEIGALLGCAEMTRTGTTAFADMYLIEDAVASAVDKSGLRALLGEGIFMFPSPAFANTEEALALVRMQHARYADHSRIRIGVMPHSVYTTTPDILCACRELADELQLPLYIHLAETESETAACLEKHGKRPVAYCAGLGFFGPNCTIAHGVVLEDEELELLARTGVRVVHNPKSNMKLASGVAPVPGMLAHGMLPGLGTDGAASNNSLNIFEEMAVCSLLHKAKSREPTVCPAGVVLDMATLGSAAALSWPELGQLVPGAPADIIALDLRSPNLQPLYEPVSHLVYAASGHEVCFSMVEGEILYQDGMYTRLDYPSLLGEAEKLRQWVLRHK